MRAGADARAEADRSHIANCDRTVGRPNSHVYRGNAPPDRLADRGKVAVASGFGMGVVKRITERSEHIARPDGRRGPWIGDVSGQ
jgi:hypothetical protein